MTVTGIKGRKITKRRKEGSKKDDSQEMGLGRFSSSGMSHSGSG